MPAKITSSTFSRDGAFRRRLGVFADLRYSEIHLDAERRFNFAY